MLREKPRAFDSIFLLVRFQLEEKVALHSASFLRRIVVSYIVNALVSRMGLHLCQALLNHALPPALSDDGCKIFTVQVAHSGDARMAWLWNTAKESVEGATHFPTKRFCPFSGTLDVFVSVYKNFLR